MNRTGTPLTVIRPPGATPIPKRGPASALGLIAATSNCGWVDCCASCAPAHRQQATKTKLASRGLILVRGDDLNTSLLRLENEFSSKDGTPDFIRAGSAFARVVSAKPTYPANLCPILSDVANVASEDRTIILHNDDSSCKRFLVPTGRQLPSTV